MDNSGSIDEYFSNHNCATLSSLANCSLIALIEKEQWTKDCTYDSPGSFVMTSCIKRSSDRHLLAVNCLHCIDCNRQFTALA